MNESSQFKTEVKRDSVNKFKLLLWVIFQWRWIHSPITLISNVTQTNKLSQRKNEKGIGYRGGQKYYNFCCKLKNDDSFRHDTYMTINREAKGPLNHGVSVARYLQEKCSQICLFSFAKKRLLWVKLTKKGANFHFLMI